MPLISEAKDIVSIKQPPLQALEDIFQEKCYGAVKAMLNLGYRFNM